MTSLKMSLSVTLPLLTILRSFFLFVMNLYANPPKATTVAVIPPADIPEFASTCETS